MNYTIKKKSGKKKNRFGSSAATVHKRPPSKKQVHLRKPVTDDRGCDISFIDSDEEWSALDKINIAHNEVRDAVRVAECTDCTQNHIHVAILGWNQGGQVLREAVDSVCSQDYPADRMTVWVHDDGSDDPSTVAEVERVCAAYSSQALRRGRCGGRSLDAKFEKDQFIRRGVRCVRGMKRLGPAAAKFHLFRAIRRAAGANDIILVVDGDDKLSSPMSLAVVNAKYIDEGVWCTYGSYRGKWNSQTKPIEDSDVLAGKTPYLPRLEKPTGSWRYGHPRSFKVHLAQHMGKSDFTYSDGTWLLKATDRAFVYRMLEVSGAARVGFITEPIYTYNYNPSSSTAATVPNDVKLAHLNHVMSMAPSAVLQIPVHIVLVSWDRILLLQDQLPIIRLQALDVFQATQRTTVLHIVNNNFNMRTMIDITAADFCTRVAKSTADVECAGDGTGASGGKTMEIVVRHQERNWHAYQRFIYVGKLRSKVPLDSVIFVDDDQLFPDGFLLKMVRSYAPKTSSHWYGKVWEPQSGQLNYWHSELNMTGIRCDKQPEIKTFQYGGPGGSIYSADLWLFERELYRLHNDLERFHDFDDLWVSYLMNSLMGWEMRRITGPIPLDAVESKTWAAAHTSGQIKHLNSVATYRNFTTKQHSSSKEIIFAELQDFPFEWNLRSLPEHVQFEPSTTSEVQTGKSTPWAPSWATDSNHYATMVLHQCTSAGECVEKPRVGATFTEAEKCVMLRGTFSSSLREARGLSIWSMLDGPSSTRRVYFYNVGLIRGEWTYRFNITACHPGSYTLRARVDFTGGDAMNCTGSRVPTLHIAPLMFDSCTPVTFTVRGGEPQGADQRGKWVHTHDGECIPSGACSTADSIMVKSIYQNAQYALGGQPNYGRFGRCIADAWRFWKDPDFGAPRGHAGQNLSLRVIRPWSRAAPRCTTDIVGNQHHDTKHPSLVWIPAEGKDIVTPWTITKTLSVLQRWGLRSSGSVFWLHWVGDSIDVRGPLSVLMELLDGMLRAFTGDPEAHRVLVCLNATSGAVTGQRRSCEERIKKHEGAGALPLLGLINTKDSVNLWTWRLSPRWSVHVSFCDRRALSSSTLLSTLRPGAKDLGVDLPPQPHAVLFNYGLHCSMCGPSKCDKDLYRAELDDKIHQLQRQLAAMDGQNDVKPRMIWRQTTMTHFDDVPLSPSWSGHTAECIITLDQVATELVRSRGFDAVVDVLTLTETRGDATLDNRHYEHANSNVALMMLGELLRSLVEVAPKLNYTTPPSTTASYPVEVTNPQLISN
jgi:glycosyltransferase involved in cell wall biosynthesis